MTPQERLKYANIILSSDAAFEADCVMLDEIEGRNPTEREKVLAGVISGLYRLIHPASDCNCHEDWEKKNKSDFLKKCSGYMVKCSKNSLHSDYCNGCFDSCPNCKTL